MGWEYINILAEDSVYGRTAAAAFKRELNAQNDVDLTNLIRVVGEYYFPVNSDENSMKKISKFST